MLQNGQTLNPQHKPHAKHSPERTISTMPNTKGSDKMQSFETSVGDISQDLIKELTLKNKLLTAQLAEYRTLVNTLNQRLQEAEDQNHRLQEAIEGRLQSTQKLHTIQEQLNSLSDITTKSRRRDAEDAKQQYVFHEISQMLDYFGLQSENMSWEAHITTIEAALNERKTLSHFESCIREMKQRIEPGDDSLGGLWQWLKKIGWNYHYLLTYNHSRDKKNTKK